MSSKTVSATPDAPAESDADHGPRDSETAIYRIPSWAQCPPRPREKKRHGPCEDKYQGLNGRYPGGKTVLVEFEDGIVWVSMNRPDKRNCINPTLAA